jgi:hypothetical protein
MSLTKKDTEIIRAIIREELSNLMTAASEAAQAMAGPHCECGGVVVEGMCVDCDKLHRGDV